MGKTVDMQTPNHQANLHSKALWL